MDDAAQGSEWGAQHDLLNIARRETPLADRVGDRSDWPRSLERQRKTLNANLAGIEGSDGCGRAVPPTNANH